MKNFDPLLRISQVSLSAYSFKMTCLQCSYYIVLLALISIMDSIVAESISLSQFFDPQMFTYTTLRGCFLSIAFFVSNLIVYLFILSSLSYLLLFIILVLLLWYLLLDARVRFGTLD